MAFFGRNRNESAYVGGKKHWADVIKNSGSGDLLIWKQPEEDFNVNSALIVMPGEEAIFIKSGVVEQVFDNGSYRLSTQNYPFISRLRNVFTGGVSTFNCVVYFVRKADSQEIIWGTDSPIQVRDKVWGIRTEARVRGAYKVRITNPVVFLEKLIGSNVNLESQDGLRKYFINEFQGKIKAVISRFLNGLPNDQELIGLDAYLDEISETIEPSIDEIVHPYGLSCIRFSLSGLDIDISKYDKFDEISMSARGKVINAQGDKGAMDVLGENWGKQQAANILGDLARNPGAGGEYGTMGAGLGMGVAAGSVFGNMANQMFAPMNPQQYQQPPQPQQPVVSGRFSPKGASSQKGVEDPVEILAKLKKLLDAGLIEQAEYDSKKAEILGRM